MKHNTADLFELEQSIDDIEGYLQPKPAELKNDITDLEKSLDDLKQHLNPKLKMKNKKRMKSNKPLNRIDLALRESKRKETTIINPNLDINFSDFEDTDISFIDFR